MSKTVYNYQEIGSEIDSCKPALFVAHPIARVTVEPRPFPEHAVRVRINLLIGETCVGICENEYGLSVVF